MKINLLGLAVVIILWVSCGETKNTEKQEESQTNSAEVIDGTIEPEAKLGYAIGDIAVDFLLKNTNDEMVSLASFPEASGYIVIFTCNQCPYSVAYEDRIIDLDKKYKALGYPVIAINPNDPEAEGGEGDDFESMKARAQEKGFTFPYLFDANQEIYPIYGATKTPHVFVLQNSEKGRVVKYIGGIDDSAREPEEVKEKYLENAINDLLAGKDIEMPETKALGCSIKTKD